MKGGSRMDFKVGVGKSDFADLRKSDNYYVDKTKSSMSWYMIQTIRSLCSPGRGDLEKH